MDGEKEELIQVFFFHIIMIVIVEVILLLPTILSGIAGGFSKQFKTGSEILKAVDKGLLYHSYC